MQQGKRPDSPTFPEDALFQPMIKQKIIEKIGQMQEQINSDFDERKGYIKHLEEFVERHSYHHRTLHTCPKIWHRLERLIS